MQCACALLSVACPDLQYFFTLSHKARYFRKKKLLNIKRVWFCPQRSSETFLILRRNERDMIKMYIGLQVKYLSFLPDFNGTFNPLDRYFEKSSNIKFHKSPSSGIRVVPCERTDRQDKASLFAILRTCLITRKITTVHTRGQQWALSYMKLLQSISHTVSIILVVYVSIITSATSISLTG
jgi:hypothetical protein